MPQEANDTALLEAAERLEALVPDLRCDIADLRRENRRNRRWIYAVAVTGLVLILAVVGFVFSYVHADSAYDKAVTVQQYQRSSCQSSNAARKGSRDLWNYVIDFSVENSKEPQTRKDRANIAELKRVINSSLADRDCSQVAKGDDSPQGK